VSIAAAVNLTAVKGGDTASRSSRTIPSDAGGPIALRVRGGLNSADAASQANFLRGTPMDVKR